MSEILIQEILLLLGFHKVQICSSLYLKKIYAKYCKFIKLKYTHIYGVPISCLKVLKKAVYLKCVVLKAISSKAIL